MSHGDPYTQPEVLMSHPDKIIAKQTGTDYSPHPEGQYAMTCVDVVDMGERLKSFKGSTPYLAPTVKIVFQSGEVNEAGRLHEVAREFTVSMHPKASLRAFLSSFRGKSYTDEQARKGVPLDKLVGQSALISVEHKTNADGSRTYANISSIAPLPKGLTPPELPAWERPAFFEEQIARYAKEAEDFRRAGAPQTTGLEDVPAALKDDESNDGLPW